MNQGATKGGRGIRTDYICYTYITDVMQWEILCKCLYRLHAFVKFYIKDVMKMFFFYKSGKSHCKTCRRENGEKLKLKEMGFREKLKRSRAEEEISKRLS